MCAMQFRNVNGANRRSEKNLIKATKKKRHRRTNQQLILIITIIIIIILIDNNDNFCTHTNDILVWKFFRNAKSDKRGSGDNNPCRNKREKR